MRRIREDDKIVDLKEFVALQKANLNLADLYLILNEIQDEIIIRTTNIRNMIPSDIWMDIFRLISPNEDLSLIFSLRTICKRWKEVFSDSPLNEATITQSSSVSWLPLLSNLHSLTIKTSCLIPVDYFEYHFKNLNTLKLCGEARFVNTFVEETKVSQIWSYLKNLKTIYLLKTSQILSISDPELNELTEGLDISIFQFNSLSSLTSLRKLNIEKLNNKNMFEFFDLLKHFINLKKLSIKQTTDYFNSKQVQVIQSYFKNDISQLESISFPTVNFLNCFQEQKRSPHVRFRWYLERKISHLNSEFDMYEGSFEDSFGNIFDGKGIYISHDRNRYVGEFKNNKREGRGTYYYSDGTRYEGEWKNNMKEGKGTFYNFEKEIGSGDWKLSRLDGVGRFVYDDNCIYEGEWVNGIREGKGIFIDSRDKSRYEGEFKNDMKDGKGITNFIDGSRYEGEFKHDLLNGRGILYYPDGNKLEGEWNDGEYVTNDRNMVVDLTESSKTIDHLNML